MCSYFHCNFASLLLYPNLTYCLLEAFLSTVPSASACSVIVRLPKRDVLFAARFHFNSFIRFLSKSYILVDLMVAYWIHCLLNFCPYFLESNLIALQSKASSDSSWTSASDSFKMSLLKMSVISVFIFLSTLSDSPTLFFISRLLLIGFRTLI